jgi:arsenate reductase
MFLCTGNSCRSQMCEGWARALHPDTIDACSAGVAPQGLSRLAVAAMAESGVDIRAHTSKPIDACEPDTLDLVVTVCDHARESCPVVPGHARVIHHAFEDPPRLATGAANDDEALPHYRRVRDEIRAFIERLPTVLREAGIDIPHEVHHDT